MTKVRELKEKQTLQIPLKDPIDGSKSGSCHVSFPTYRASQFFFSSLRKAMRDTWASAGKASEFDLSIRLPHSARPKGEPLSRGWAHKSKRHTFCVPLKWFEKGECPGTQAVRGSLDLSLDAFFFFFPGGLR